MKRKITIDIPDEIWNELILFTQEELEKYISKAVIKRVKKDMK